MNTVPLVPLVVRLRDIMPNDLVVSELARQARALLALQVIRVGVAAEAAANDQAQATDEMYALRAYGAQIADYTPTAEVPADVLLLHRPRRATYTPRRGIHAVLGGRGFRRNV